MEFIRLPSLQERRRKGNMILIYKIVIGKVNILNKSSERLEQLAEKRGVDKNEKDARST